MLPNAATAIVEPSKVREYRASQPIRAVDLHHALGHDHPMPPLLLLLARLGVHLAWQGHGVGQGLLKDAMQRTVQAADIAGIRALAVHAKNAKARDFYRHFNFIDSPTDPMHLFLLVKDLRRYFAIR